MGDLIVVDQSALFSDSEILVTTYTFDDAGNRLTKMTDTDPTGITYDADDFIVYDFDPSTTPFTENAVTTYAYDANDRLLTEARDTDHDGTADEYIVHGYTGTVQTATTTHAGDDAADPVSASTTFTFDHRGRQSGATVDPDGVATVKEKTRTEYAYEDSGIRIRQTTVKVEADSDDEVPSSETTTEYVVSHDNHTGYAQTIEEWVDDWQGTRQTRSYTSGQDAIIGANAGRCGVRVWV